MVVISFDPSHRIRRLRMFVSPGTRVSMFPSRIRSVTLVSRSNFVAPSSSSIRHAAAASPSALNVFKLVRLSRDGSRTNLLYETSTSVTCCAPACNSGALFQHATCALNGEGV